LYGHGERSSEGYRDSPSGKRKASRERAIERHLKKIYHKNNMIEKEREKREESFGLGSSAIDNISEKARQKRGRFSSSSGVASRVTKRRD